MGYKNIIFDEYDSLSDKIISLNNNDIYIKEYADRIEQGVYLYGSSSSTSLTTTPTSKFLETFFVTQPDRLICVEALGDTYITHSSPGVNAVNLYFEIDSVQVFHFRTDLVLGDTTSQYATWSGCSFLYRCETPGEYELNVKMSKADAGSNISFSSEIFVIRDIGKYIAPEA